MNQFGMKYTYAWKQHKESPCVAIFISNTQKCHVFLLIFVFSSTKPENKRVLPGRVGEGGPNNVYTCQ
jgi:hypothetical protein